MATLRSLRVFEAVGAVLVLFVACVEPPNLGNDSSAGSGGKGGSTGGSTAAGSGGTSAGTGGSSAGTGGSTAKGGKGGSTAKGGKGGGTSATGGTGGGTGASGGTGANGGTTGTAAGEGGMSAGEGGMNAGEGGAPSSGSAGSGGSGGMVTVGGKSSLPLPPTSGVAKPSGTQGNLQIINWAGFKGALSYTFDDSLQSQIDHYAELHAVGVPMTFYLVCGNDGGKTAWKTAYTDGNELGNHTMHHCNADGTSCGWGAWEGSTAAELDDCETHLETAYGIPYVYTMAAPMGDPGWQAPASTRFLANRGVNDSPAGVKPNDATSPFNLPCHIANQGETAVGGFNLIADDVETKGSWRIILNHSLSPGATASSSGSSPDGYHPVDPAEVVAAMTYARDKHDVWIDTVVNIAAYWRAQKTISAVTPVQSGGDITYSWTLPDHFPPGQYLRVKVDGGTVKQLGTELTWDEHGYYEITLDALSVTISP